MGTSNRDVTLGVSIETSGAEALQNLSRDIRRLGADAGPAAAQFAALAEQTDRLAQQAAQAERVGALSSQVEALAQAERDAAAAANQAREALESQAAIVASARERQSQYRQAVAESQTAVREAAQAIREYKDGVDSSTRSTEPYKQGLQALQRTLIEKKTALDLARIALTEYGTTVGQAVNEETKLAAAANRTATAQEAATRALGQRTSELQASQQALVNAGAATTDLAAAQQTLAAEEQNLRAEFSALKQATDESRLALELQQQEANQAAQAYTVLVGSLKGAQAAAVEYAAATESAAAAGSEDAQAVERRVAAARALLASDQQLTVEQRALANALDSGRNAALAQAQALVRQTEAAVASQKATAALVRESLSAGDALQTAFGTTGVRSLQAIEAEALAVERSVSLLERQFRTGAISAQDLARAVGAAQVRLEGLRAEAAQVQSLPGPFERVNATVNGLITKFGALSAAIATVAVAARPAIEAFIALDQSRRILTSVTGSAEVAAQQIEFLRRTAQTSGQSFNDLAESYAKFAASATQAGLSLTATQEVFASVSNAAGNLGLSSDQTKRALEALSQMASKGTVSMEELRQQLGDALPGVFPLLAQQLGLTTRELQKLIETGNLSAKEAIPAIAGSLKKLGAEGGGEVKGLVAEWARFKNALSETATLLGDGAVGTAVGLLGRALSGIAGAASVAVAGISEIATVTARAAGAAVGTLTGGGGLAAAWEAVNEQLLASGSRLESLLIRWGFVDESARRQAQSVNATGESFAKLRLRMAEQQEAADLAARSADKHAQALDYLVKAAEATAKVTIDQREATLSVSQAQAAYAEALGKQAAADQAAADIASAALRAVREAARARGESVDAIKAETEELTKKALATQAEAEKTAAAARAARQKAEADELAYRATINNSKETGELIRQLGAAERAYDSVQRRFTAGKATTDDVSEATRQLALAKARLKDALQDVISNLDREISLLRSETTIKEANLKIEQEQLKTKLALAKAAGDQVAQKVIESRLAELEARQLATKNDLSARELSLQFEQLRVQEEELRRTGQLTADKETEIRTRRNLLIAKTLELQAAQEGVKQKVIESQADAAAIATIGQKTTAVQGATTAAQAGTVAAQGHASATTSMAGAAGVATTALQGLGTSTGLTNTALGDGKTVLGEYERALLQFSDAALLASAAQRVLSESNLGKGPAGILGTSAGGTPITGVRTPGSGGNAGGAGAPLPSVSPAPGGSQSGFSIGYQLSPPDNSGNWEFDVAAYNAAGGVNAGFGLAQLQRFWRLKPEAAAASEKALVDAANASRSKSPGLSGVSLFGSVQARQSSTPAAASEPVAVAAIRDEQVGLAVAAKDAMSAGNVQLANAIQNFTALLTSAAYGGKTVNVNLNLGGKTASVPTTEAGAQALLKLLEEAQRGVGTGGP